MLLLLTEVRKKLLWCWLVLIAIVLGILLLQDLNGVFEGTEGVAWRWLALCTLPGLAPLLLAAVLNLNPGKFIWRPVYQVILAITVIYLLFVLITLIGMRARPAEQSLVDYFRLSYYRPSLAQLLVVAVYALLFFRRETAFLPNENIIREYAAKPLAEARATGNLAQQQALEIFVAGDYDTLFDRLRQQFQGKDAEADKVIILLEAQYNETRKQRALGTISAEEAGRTMSRIAVAILDYIKKV